MPFKPTPEQVKEIEDMSSFQERQNALDLMELEYNEAQGSLPDDESATPEVKVKEEVSIPQPSPVEPVQPTAEEPAKHLSDDKPSDERDVEYWKKQAETWKKRKGDSDRALTPAQQEAARLKKDQADSQAKYEERLARMEALLEKAVAQKSAPVDFEPEDEFDTEYADVSRKIKQVTRLSEERIKADYEAKIRAIEERSRKSEAQMEEESRRAYSDSHFAQVKAIHSDAEDFFSDDKLGPALVEWAKTQPNELYEAITNPLGHTPQYVAYVISQFKNVTRYTAPQAKKPSLGDIATKAGIATQPRMPEVEAGIFKDSYTGKEFDADLLYLNNHYNDPVERNKKMDELENKYERTLIHRHNNQ